MSYPFRQRRRREPAATCAFCDAEIPRPTKIDVADHSPDAKGGRCSCGALFTFDVNGKGGGEAVIEGLILLCDGDAEKAMRLEEKVHYRLRRRGYDPRSHSLVSRVKGMGGYGQPKLWFFRLKKRPADSVES